MFYKDKLLQKKLSKHFYILFDYSLFGWLKWSLGKEYIQNKTKLWAKYKIKFLKYILVEIYLKFMV